MMVESVQLLPPEVWNHVFRYLSEADKFSVRACCKYFKKLVDHRSLWKCWSVILSFPNGYYNSQFWSTLRRRNVTCVVVRSSKTKDWKQLSVSLPALTTIIIQHSRKARFDCLKDFLQVKRLAVRNSCTPHLLDRSTLCRPQQLTHLSMCGVKFPTTTTGSFLSAVSQFTNLTSLVCHDMEMDEETFLLIHSILTCLPKLKHLSLSTVHRLGKPLRPNPGPIRGVDGKTATSCLSSLELIGCVDKSLPETAMRLMPGLKKLAVFYAYSKQGMQERWPAGSLKTWLSDLSQLSTLVIVKGPLIKTFVTSIPATVTSLTVCVGGLSLEDMEALSKRLPNLLHLQIDPWPSHLGAHTAQIPHLFPRLESLKLRHEHVPEKDFLDLHQLQDLKYLDILDSRPHLSEIVGKLKALTNNFHVRTSPFQRDVMYCQCVSQVY